MLLKEASMYKIKCLDCERVVEVFPLKKFGGEFVVCGCGKNLGYVVSRLVLDAGKVIGDVLEEDKDYIIEG